ncbi:aminoacyl-histidine dipeptidase [Peptoniphilus catoniae]|uniref:aminoacyl-histidine dipeptidase n=1 Tax=Peptoniphilus catoniae TaxID=1660341 RepID=UPI0010FE2368|nr:aminoacyl-histidine dipeptidase [Peptoniphilus catoniae]
MSKLENIEPKRVFHYFEEITKIPRCSFKEEKIADYLVNFAESFNLEYIRDEYNNIIIKKPASLGYENSPGIILQGHTDMVCEKLEGVDFDFDKDPIDFSVEGDRITAKNTTLGADNGIGVAMILAILESDNYEHPYIEALLTATEESGMIGAKNLDGSLFTSETLLNLDSETEGKGCIACSSGQRDNIVFKKKFQLADKVRQFYYISLSGLKGGHSGEDINKGRGNANKLLARSLKRINQKFGISLVDISGGSKENAIPRYAKAIIAIDPNDKKGIQDEIVKINRDFVKEIGKVDPDVRLNFEKAEKSDKSDKFLDDELKENIINLLYILPNGVSSMSHNIRGLVGTSSNLGVIESSNEEIIIHISIRSELESLRNEISKKNNICSELCNAEHFVISSYPAWEYKENSKIRDLAKEVYKNLKGENLEFEAIHAGLECGILKEVIGDIDMLSIGPNMHGIHAPGESLEIQSTKNIFEFVIELLKRLK